MKTVYVMEGIRRGWFRNVRHVLGVFDSMEQACKASSELEDLYVDNEYDDILIQGIPYNAIRDEATVKLSKDYCIMRSRI